jgi:hypothetical protein
MQKEFCKQKQPVWPKGSPRSNPKQLAVQVSSGRPMGLVNWFVAHSVRAAVGNVRWHLCFFAFVGGQKFIDILNSHLFIRDGIGSLMFQRV